MGPSPACPLAGTLLKLLRLTLWVFVPVCLAGATDVLTYHNDNARTGQNLNETILTTSNVNSNTFGKLFVLSVDGKVDAQTLYLSAVTLPGRGTHNVLFVATEHSSFYAFDADTGAALWQVSLLKAGETPSDDRGCNQVTPEIGITATPVIDRTSGPNGTLYLVSMSRDASSNYFQRLHALDVTTGQEEFGGPKDIQATFPGTGANSSGGKVIFDPAQYKERPGLLLLNGVVYTSWSSHCDFNPYTGWVMGYDEKTLSQLSVLNLAPNGGGGSVWASGAGPAADPNGNIYFLAANGSFDTTLNASGFPNQGDYGNAFLKLSTINNSLAVADYFNMSNTVAESNADQDLGSGGALVLPDMTDAQGKTRHLAVGAGKDQIIYLVDRDNMGKFNPSNNNIYQELPAALNGQEFGMPAYFNGTIYYGAAGDNLVAIQFSKALLATSPASKTGNTFGYPGATPSVSANASSNGIVWAAENSDPAVLHAYDAANLSTELYNSSQAAGGRDQFGAGNKFITPTIAAGKVYVGTTSGVGVFGLLGTPPSGGDFSISTATGSSASATVGAGQTATYKLTLASTQGFSGTVNFTCGGAPQLATCLVNPNPATLNGTSTANVSVTVSTMPRSMTGTRPFAPPLAPLMPKPQAATRFAALLVLSALAVISGAASRRQVRRALAVVVLFLSLIALPSCGGGNVTGSPGTPSGTYPLTVTATSTSGSNTLTHTMTLTLTVN